MYFEPVPVCETTKCIASFSIQTLGVCQTLSKYYVKRRRKKKRTLQNPFEVNDFGPELTSMIYLLVHRKSLPFDIIRKIFFLGILFLPLFMIIN